MSENRRNSWIAAALMGLLVWVLTAGTGPLGVFSGLFLGLLTALMLGPTLAWLFDRGTFAAGHDERMTFDHWGRSHTAAAAAGEAPVRERVMDAAAGGPVGAAAFVAHGGGIARPARPAQSQSPGAVRLGAPEGATASAAEAVTFTPAGESGGDRATGGPGPSADQPPDPFSTAAPAANDTPAADTRAVMHTPSESERHDMPGEAVPGSEPRPRKADRARMAETGSAAPDAETKG